MAKKIDSLTCQLFEWLLVILDNSLWSQKIKIISIYTLYLQQKVFNIASNCRWRILREKEEQKNAIWGDRLVIKLKTIAVHGLKIQGDGMGYFSKRLCGGGPQCCKQSKSGANILSLIRFSLASFFEKKIL